MTEMNEMTRLDRLRPGNLGNLGFLPIEICNVIYTFLLADFKPCENNVQLEKFSIDAHLSTSTRARHSIDTAILRASRDIYREAYDLMVKKNRFVRVRSYGFPQCLLNAASMPVVTENEDHVQRFRGYVLEVTLKMPDDWAPDMPPYADDIFEVIALAKDLGKLCLGLTEGELLIPGLNNKLSLTLNLGPTAAGGRETLSFEDSESLEQYYSEKNQKEIIRPFCGLPVGNVRVSGLVSADIIHSLRKSAARSEWDSPSKVLHHLIAQTEIATLHLMRGEDWLASNLRMKIICEMNMLHRGDLWPRFVLEGGECFITDFANLYHDLNIVCASFYTEEVGGYGTFNRLVENLLKQAREATTMGFWKEGFTWQPTLKSQADFHFTMACFLRGRAYYTNYGEIANQFRRAVQLYPEEPKFLAGQVEFLEEWEEWKRDFEVEWEEWEWEYWEFEEEPVERHLLIAEF